MTFSPTDLAGLLRVDLPGDVSWDELVTGTTIIELHTALTGPATRFRATSRLRAARLRDTNERWLVTARVNNEVVRVATYHIIQHGGDLVADNFLIANPLSRALLLQFFARHIDQVARVIATVPPDETPELWA